MESAKTLGTYLAALKAAGLLVSSTSEIDGKLPISSVTYDSRQAGPGCLFVAKGAHFEQRYLRDALAAGAVAVLAEEGFLPPEQSLALAQAGALLEVTDLRRALPLLADIAWGSAWRQLQIVGITGTKGKSTTAYYVKSILDCWLTAQGQPECGLLSSIDAYDGKQRFESHITTPEVFELHQHFANATASGLQYFVMEVSSQALKYRRTDGVEFAVGAFLNIGQDHISDIEHSDFKDYLQAKLRLFAQCRTAVVNADTAEAASVLAAARQAPQLVTFSASTATRSCAEPDLLACDIVSRTTGVEFTARDASGAAERFVLGMTGLFNVENALAAICCARALGVPEGFIHQGLQQARAGGRMELFETASGAIVLVDYAHNEMSFQALFDSVAAEYPGRRCSIVFGCPGEHAFQRRRDLGLAAGQHCAMTYLTEEDPRSEDVHQISCEIAAYVAEAGGACRIIDDREEAICTALDEADAQTVVLITGKGRETRQKRGNEYVEVPSDVEIVQRYCSQGNQPQGSGILG
ncbi:MAG: UDP-N-acetylmuramyl-tripeptide synthetase [Coriobacteriales bacterium]|jgi:UDP-N-acetylmuramoyl-L-alanyl-D-glutamate--2,6-diaminopimelate ligase|nr:UDP-N-acetylmuramyl-tripeptide synthetase [Coriobacteriales bacterium]